MEILNCNAMVVNSSVAVNINFYRSDFILIFNTRTLLLMVRYCIDNKAPLIVVTIIVIRCLLLLPEI